MNATHVERTGTHLGPAARGWGAVAAGLRRGALAAAWTAVLLLSAGHARADVTLSLGVYAPDDQTARVWRCRGVVSALERHMSGELDEIVHLEVDVDEDYDHGVAAFMDGTVSLARFPNVQGHWTVHPSLAPRTVEAWRSAMTTLGVEAMSEAAVDGSSCGRRVGSFAQAGGGEGADTVAGRVPFETLLNLAAAHAGRPPPTFAEIIEALPPTGAGAPATQVR